MAKLKRIRVPGKPKKTVLCDMGFTASRECEGRRNPENHWFVTWPDGAVMRAEVRLSEAQAKLLLNWMAWAYHRGGLDTRARIHDALGLDLELERAKGTMLP